MQKNGKTIVLKFGGSSLNSDEKREIVVSRIIEKSNTYENVVVVVSAIGREGEPYATDSLLKLTNEFKKSAPREVDALISCGENISAAVIAGLLNLKGKKALSLTAAQAGIITTGSFQNARIKEIYAGNIKKYLDDGFIVVITGFQGIDENGNVMTIGRGGSDTTAVILGVALNSDAVEIYTDVEGVFSGDPRVVKRPQLIEMLKYDEAAELAYKGAKVIHPVATEIAKFAEKQIIVKSTFSLLHGTTIGEKPNNFPLDPINEKGYARAVTSTSGISQFAVSGTDFSVNRMLLDLIFKKISERNVSLDMINIFPEKIYFTVKSDDVSTVSAVLSSLKVNFYVNNRCSKVTLVGAGIHGVPGVMYRIVHALSKKGITIYQSVDSSTIISVLVDEEKEEEAVKTIHAEFFES